MDAKPAIPTNRHTDGFTLIEVVISLSIAVLIFLLLTQIYLMAQTAFVATDSQSEITQNGRVILDRLIREIRQTPDIVTQLPADAADPETLPSEIVFQDGHDLSQIKYIRYYLSGTDISRQIIVYYFPSEPDYYVYYYDTDKDAPHDPPIMQILEDKVIGEYAADLEFWGSQLLNINLYLSKNSQSLIINTAVYGRNL
ncbi:MAG: prepilin-type N-terminal cleavage/methylation domain-containing protein [Patescibacteria group bacterium]